MYSIHMYRTCGLAASCLTTSVATGMTLGVGCTSLTV